MITANLDRYTSQDKKPSRIVSQAQILSYQSSCDTVLVNMPPPLPTGATASRLIPSVTRAFASLPSSSSDTPPPPSPTPNKDHHIHTYGPEAFPLGFQVASVHCGIKKKAGVLDLGILVSTSERACSAAACVTRNVFKAAPVTVTNELLKTGDGKARGFIVNSGCANAVTGKKGLEDAWSMSKGVTSQIPPAATGAGTKDGQGTLVMSTGVIGQHLPIDKITGQIPDLVRNLSESPKAWLDLARSFMTTDTFPKLRTRTFTLGDRVVRMAGIDKGAGMIAPNMGPPHATLLGVIATDAAISPPALQSALNYAVDRSFNSITVDGDMSTNDTILCLANGAAGSVNHQGRETGSGMEEITEEGHPKEFGQFKEELREFAEDLAKLVVRDGEGATKFVTVRVKVSSNVLFNGLPCKAATWATLIEKGAPTYEVANAVAKSVASSSLVKTAMYGEGMSLSSTHHQ